MDHDPVAVIKLTRTEFAVVRAYAQGMKPQDIANRYLVGPDDEEMLSESEAIQRILGLRDRLVQFALQHNQPEIAAMVESLRARTDVGMTRRIDALSSLEQLGQGHPQPQHHVSLWFRPSLARRLAAANLRHIAELTALANARGSSWWRAVPRIGPKSAEIITAWLIRQRPVMGDRSLHAYVIPPSAHRRRAPLSPLPLGPAMAYPVPLEHMLTPCPSLGTPVQNALTADLAFIRTWLRTHAGTPHTLQSYRREAERLLLWAARQRKALRDLTSEDLDAYQDFLAGPEPNLFWCGPSGPRDREHWRPFERALRPSSIAAALRVVRALLSTMAKTGALREPARRASASPTSGPQSSPRQHNPHREAFLAWLGSPGQSERHRAAHVAALLMGRPGLRLVELPSLRGAHLRHQGNRVSLLRPARPDEPVWLDSKTWQALCRHMTDRGLDARQLPAEAALLAPRSFPTTRRGRRKQLAGSAAGYSASGIDQLLRAMWRHFCRAHDLTVHSFTPRQIAGLPAD